MLYEIPSRTSLNWLEIAPLNSIMHIQHCCTFYSILNIKMMWSVHPATFTSSICPSLLVGSRRTNFFDSSSTFWKMKMSVGLLQTFGDLPTLTKCFCNYYFFLEFSVQLTNLALQNCAYWPPNSNWVLRYVVVADIVLMRTLALLIWSAKDSVYMLWFLNILISSLSNVDGIIYSRLPNNFF